jgi:hypothetical protein
VSIIQGDALHLPLADESIDAIVCDPPYSLAFMSRAWDTHSSPEAFAEWCETWAREAYRVLKPGGHLLAAGSSRTFHRLACGIEDAGFKMRDTITHHFGQGFPKSKRQVDGWGTALKPATEFWTVARKPLGERTVAGNVQAWGTGAINVDGCRVGTGGHLRWSAPRDMGYHGGTDNGSAVATTAPAGRWPTNVVLTHTPDCVEVGARKVKTGTAVKGNLRPGETLWGQAGSRTPQADQSYAADGTETIPAYECAAGCPVAELDAQSGITTSATGTQSYVRAETTGWLERGGSFTPGREWTAVGHGDTGGASRFFPTFRYQAKAPTRERVKVNGVAHPTTKPLELMRWLVRLVTPPGGTVLDPFSGSGTTAEACILEGFKCVAIERDATYLPLIAARVKRQAPEIVPEDIPADILTEVIRLGQLTLEVTV